MTELEAYRRLHDGLSDMIEGGRLTAADLPEDYRWLVDALASVPATPGNVRRYLDASTAHVRQVDREILKGSECGDRTIRAPGGGLLIVDAYEYGWWVHVQPDEPDEQRSIMADLGCSPEFRNLVDYTRSVGCDWLRLDSDGDEIDGAPVFEEEF